MHARRLTILHAVAPSAVGGIESVIRLLVAGQRRRGHDASVLVLLEDHSAELPAVAALAAAGIPVERVLVPRRRYWREYRLIARACRAHRPDVVHTHGYHADLVAGAAARRVGVVTVTTVHGYTGGDWKNRLYEWLQRRAFHRFDAVVAVSAPLAASLAAADGVAARRLHLLPNAYAGPAPLDRKAARARLGIPPDEIRVGWLGRLTPEKGADVAIRALAELHGESVRLSVIGDGVERAALERLARQLGVAERITWHGIIPEAGRLLAAFDAMVISSRSEGTPIVLFEAMAACVPVVTTRVGGIPDVVSAAHALLVAPDAPRSIADALRTLRADPGGGARRAHDASQRLERCFAIEPWLDAYDEVYRRALAAAGGPRA